LIRGNSQKYGNRRNYFIQFLGEFLKFWPVTHYNTEESQKTVEICGSWIDGKIFSGLNCPPLKDHVANKYSHSTHVQFESKGAST